MMNWKNFTRNLKDKLRDPMWQFVGVVVALAGLIVAIWLTPSAPEKSGKANMLRIYAASGSKNLTDFPDTVAARTRILIDGKDERDVKYFAYIFDYEGDKPIRAADFEFPIKGLVPPNRKIIGVQQSLDWNVLQTPMRLDRSDQQQIATEAQITCEIQQTDQRSVEIKPMLMNSGDWFRIEFYTSALQPDDSSAKASPSRTTETEGAFAQDISWSCRIAGVKCPADKENFEIEVALRSDSSDPLDASISDYRGWAVYFLVLFTIFNLLLLVVLAKQTRVVRSRPALLMILFSVAVFLSMAVAEILADWIFNEHSLKAQPTAAKVLLLSDIVVLLLLGLSAARSKQRIVTGNHDAYHDTHDT